MQILRFTYPPKEQRSRNSPVLTPLSITGEYAAVQLGDDLQLFDVRDASVPVCVIPDVFDHALQPGVLVTSSLSGALRRYEIDGGACRTVTDLPIPLVADGQAPKATKVLLSPSGRHLVIESGPISTGEKTWPVAQAFLMDAVTGDLRRTFRLRKTNFHGNFVRLPGGREALLIAAESYMGVQLVDCETGGLLHAYIPDRESFCHTNFALSSDGTRLYTAGCIWACPYEVRVYDFTRWLAPSGANDSASSGFPLRLVYQRGEVIYGEFVEEVQPPQTRDGAFTCVSQVRLATTHEYPTSEIPFDLDPAPSDHDILGQLLQLPASGVVFIVRRINPLDGSENGNVLRRVETAENMGQAVHVRPDHQVVLVNERVWHMDGWTGELEDLGPADPPARWFRSVLSADGDTLVLWGVQGT